MQEPGQTTQNEPKNPDKGLDLGEGVPEERRRFLDPKLAEKIERKKTSLKAAIGAHCHECLGHYQDGKVDCENRKCPLYAHMPYRRLSPDFDWCKYNQKKVGKSLETYDAESARAAKDMFAKLRRNA